MIKANELRIGNHVLYKPYGNRDGELVTIAGLEGMKAYFSKYSNESGMFHNLRPIPLTPEILEKCGFVKESDRWRPYDGEADGVLYTMPGMQIIVDRENGTFHRLTTANENEYGYYDCEIKYLHQLQNLFFALTGEELSVQL